MLDKKNKGLGLRLLRELKRMLSFKLCSKKPKLSWHISRHFIKDTWFQKTRIFHAFDVIFKVVLPAQPLISKWPGKNHFTTRSWYGMKGLNQPPFNLIVSVFLVTYSFMYWPENINSQAYKKIMWNKETPMILCPKTWPNTNLNLPDVWPATTWLYKSPGSLYLKWGKQICLPYKIAAGIKWRHGKEAFCNAP